MAEYPIQEFSGPALWAGTELERQRSWEFVLSAADRQELFDALEQVNTATISLAQISAKNFPLPTLANTLSRIREELQDGLGFALVRNFPVEDQSLEDLEKMYWGLCSHLGAGVTQNSDRGFIHYVTDGVLRPNQGSRGVGLPGPTPLHVDLSDVASLLCLRQAPDRPPSRVASAAAIHNVILAEHPEYLPDLYRGYEWDRMGEHGSEESATSGYLVPVFSAAQGMLSCQYNRNWMESAARRKSQMLSARDTAAFDFIDETAHALCFEFPFAPGEIQFCNNYTVMHGRAAHGVVSAENEKRLLMRIWMNIRNFRAFSDEAIVRYGIGYHGQLGWSAADVLEGRAGSTRARRADGALSLGSTN